VVSAIFGAPALRLVVEATELGLSSPAICSWQTVFVGPKTWGAACGTTRLGICLPAAARDEGCREWRMSHVSSTDVDSCLQWHSMLEILVGY